MLYSGTDPESYITKYTSIRKLKTVSPCRYAISTAEDGTLSLPTPRKSTLIPPRKLILISLRKSTLTPLRNSTVVDFVDAKDSPELSDGAEMVGERR